MKDLIFVNNYQSILDVIETQTAIKFIKDTFQTSLSKELNLYRVSAPLFIEPKTGLNDNLSGIEVPVTFSTKEGEKLEIVHSLAKWKRFALKRYNLLGLYTDMNAIRSFEDLDNIHSLYVDQWDWEKVITNKERNISYLKNSVNKIYKVFLNTYAAILEKYPNLKQNFASEVYFIDSEELRKKYPDKSSKEREYLITKEFGTVFIIGIGKKLADGTLHDSRAADYDDWNLNGDLFVYYSLLDIALELSSMGIRVDSDSLIKQLEIKNEMYKMSNSYHQDVLSNNLPLTIGGGIGQSRLCMLLLKKAHIGEVQASYWPKKDIESFKAKNIFLL